MAMWLTAIASALTLVADATWAQDAAPTAPDCAEGLPGIKAQVVGFFDCIETAARRLEPSDAPAEIIARGAVSSCDTEEISAKAAATACDDAGVTSNMKSIGDDLERKGADDAVRVVLE